MKKIDPARKASRIRARLRRTVKFATPWPAVALRRWKSEGRVFCVRWRDRDLYPAFQFGPGGFPRHGMRRILSVVPQDARGWPLLSWFEAGNMLLNTRKPSQVFKIRSSRVLAAAKQFYSLED